MNNALKEKTNQKTNFNLYRIMSHIFDTEFKFQHNNSNKKISLFQT